MNMGFVSRKAERGHHIPDLRWGHRHIKVHLAFRYHWCDDWSCWLGRGRTILLSLKTIMIVSTAMMCGHYQYWPVWELTTTFFTSVLLARCSVRLCALLIWLCRNP